MFWYAEKQNRCDMQIAHVQFARKEDLKTMNSAGQYCDEWP